MATPHNCLVLGDGRGILLLSNASGRLLLNNCPVVIFAAPLTNQQNRLPKSSVVQRRGVDKGAIHLKYGQPGNGDPDLALLHSIVSSGEDGTLALPSM